MSLETQISELNATIKTLNETIKLLLQRDVISTPQTTIPPVQEEAKQPQETFLPEVAKEAPSMTRESLQTFCLEAVKRNAANRDIIKSIMLNNFEARKTGDLADNQINLCYSMIAEATKD
jgi:hypothetical protein